MGKKESPKKEENHQPKIPGLSSKAFGIVKFILGICLLPFVYSTSVAFLNEFAIIEKILQNYFWQGLISLSIIYLFVWEPVIIYKKGQRLLEIIFSFFRPLVRVAPYLLPIYTVVLFMAYWILSYVFSAKGGSLPVRQAGASGGKSLELINYFIFLLGFSIGLHLVFSAKSLRSKQADFLKANYIFGFSLLYIINLMILAFGLNLIFENFSFVNFFNNSFQIAKSIFGAMFKQFFL